MSYTVNRLGPQFAHGPFAAEFLGANLHEPPSDPLIDAFEEAMATYAVVVLRDAHIDDAEQVRFARAFGPLELPPHMGLRPAAMKVRVGHGLYDISNLDANGDFLPADSLRLIFNKGNENFHTDSSFNTLPTKWSMLSARVVPPTGGDTEFCDARAAWDALPEGLREHARTAVAEHWLWKTRVDAGKMPITGEMRAAMPPARHPVVRTVPDSGRSTLYLGAHVTHIVDWPKPQSDRFIADINAHIARPEFRYVHRWRVGDLLVWDNRCTLHRAT
ncbi:MAG TPA: TauD/TfdA family dioxygenase, partial [Steroidobacteraceae bacterium]